MTSKIHTRWILRTLGAVFALLSSSSLCAQVLDPQPPDAIPLFDSIQNVVFFGYGTLHPGGPALRAYTGGHQRGGDINVFKDFPDLQYAVINSFAAGPASSSVLAAVLGYGKNVVRHVLLFYGDRGQLLKIWDTDPYYAYALAVDSDGDVYSLAVRTDVNDKNGPDYPLLIHYQPDGAVVQKSLPKSVFRGRTAQAITSVRGTILPVLRIKEDRILVFAPLHREVVIGTKKGGSWERHELQEHPGVKGVSNWEIRNVDFTSNGDLVVEERGRGEGGLVTELQRINPKTGERKTLKRVGGNTPDVFVSVFDDHYLEITRDQSGRKVFRLTELSASAPEQK